MWIKHRTSIFLALSFLILFSGFWFFPSFAFIFFISVLLKLLLNPIVDKLERKLPRGVAAAITVFCSLIFIIGGIIVISQSFIPSLQVFMTELPDLTYRLQTLITSYSEPYITTNFNELWGELSDTGMNAIKSSFTLLLSLFSKIIDLVIIVFVTFYMLKDGDQIQRYLSNLFPNGETNRVHNLFNKITISLEIYVRSQLCMCLLTGVVVMLYFTFFNLPYSSVFAVMSGLGELIPVLGPTVASVVGVLLTATQSTDLALQTAFFYLILTQVNHNIVYPTLIGKSLNLHPAAIILGVVFGGELLGAAGMFLAVPCMVIFKHVIEDIHEHQ